MSDDVSLNNTASEPTNDRLVFVHLAGSIAEARVVVSVLDAEGIPAIVNGLEHASVAWDHQIALGGLRVAVPEVYMEAARSRLQMTDFDPVLWQSQRFWKKWYLYAPFAMIAGLLGIPLPSWIRPHASFYLLGFFLILVALGMQFILYQLSLWRLF